MFPVFSLVLDQDISSYIAVTYPELYKELSKGRSLSYKTFFMWVLISIYQGEWNVFISKFSLWFESKKKNIRELYQLYVVYVFRWRYHVRSLNFIWRRVYPHRSYKFLRFNTNRAYYGRPNNTDMAQVKQNLNQILILFLLIQTTCILYFRLMVLAEIFSLLLYLISLAVLHEYFGKLTFKCPFRIFSNAQISIQFRYFFFFF